MWTGLMPSTLQWCRCGRFRGRNLAESVAVRRRFRAGVGVFCQTLTTNRDVISDVIGEMSTAGENIRRRIKTVPDPIRAQHALAIVDSVPQRSIGEMISKANSLMQLSSNKPDEWKFSVEIANTAMISGASMLLVIYKSLYVASCDLSQ